ncbi:succinylglutamate desuccinylase/aspartoacylase domain-containing protein [Candidatus Halobonum tyrrellensis]|uniref:Succinylglutamate desuccinylase/aspartoacylase n=1 Tax=Candidatus Halobonum tyrrellensis G22 TaxID=1324957 RepID=V4GU80_9EURY|nr:succinylglutamate desuccinylase/aspartoacylase family protein [Candidatus Halobonum tyrrellensis]ESP88686.1 succinylglutamate desuccinylase/aspartoacylase [Candidatus Halobonum tyrrellensis G22]
MKFHNVSPDIAEFGPGDPELAVVCNVHGDEPTGARAVRRIIESSPTFERGVKFVVANPPASIAHRRFLDADMNRVFPGDQNADDLERRLAAQLVEETAGLVTLAIHTTHATPEPIAFISEGHPRSLEVASQLPIASVVNETPVVESSFSSTGPVVSIEAGRVETPNAIGKAEMLIRAFLNNEDALSEGAPMYAPDTTYFEIYDEVEKPSGDESYELLARNFERVQADEAYARSTDGTLLADDPFVPILMSQSGYSSIFGYRGRKIGETVDDAKTAWTDSGE